MVAASTVSVAAPGPVIATGLASAGRALVSVIVPVAVIVIVSPGPPPALTCVIA